MIETDQAGGLGKAYCVVDGTGGDKQGNEGMSGKGVVSVLGGKIVLDNYGVYNEGALVFENYRRAGT
jgi:hypothetical protein